MYQRGHRSYHHTHHHGQCIKEEAPMRIKELALEPRCKRDKHRRSTDTYLVEGSYRQQGRSSHKGGGKHRRPTESKEPTTRGRQQKGHQRQGHKKKIHKMSMSNGWDVASVHALGMYTTPCVSRVGVEPTTPGFSVPSSNQLSYRNFIENPRGDDSLRERLRVASVVF